MCVDCACGCILFLFLLFSFLFYYCGFVLFFCFFALSNVFVCLQAARRATMPSLRRTWPAAHSPSRMEACSALFLAPPFSTRRNPPSWAFTRSTTGPLLWRAKWLCTPWCTWRSLMIIVLSMAERLSLSWSASRSVFYLFFSNTYEISIIADVCIYFFFSTRIWWRIPDAWSLICNFSLQL